MINKPPPLNRDYDRDPNIKALKRRGLINHGSTLESSRGIHSLIPQDPRENLGTCMILHIMLLPNPKGPRAQIIGF